MSPDKNNKNYKVCSVCGKTSPGDSEYCQYCGKKITAAGQGQVLSAPAAEKESFLSDEKNRRYSAESRYCRVYNSLPPAWVLCV